MSSVVQDDLSSLSNEQLRARLVQNGLANMPVTDTTRTVLIKRLRSVIKNGITDSRRETFHVPKSHGENESKPAPKKTANSRRITVGAISLSDDIVPLPKSQSIRRSGRITPTLKENDFSKQLVYTEKAIVELDELPYVDVTPKRTSRSPSLGKSQTVITSYKTEVAKPSPIVENSGESDESEESESDEENAYQKIYPSLAKINGFSKDDSSAKATSNLRRTTAYITQIEPTTYRSCNDDASSFKESLKKPSAETSGVNRRYTKSSYTFKHPSQVYEDESGTEQSDIDTPYLSDFTKRLSQLKAEPINRKIIADVKQHHHTTDEESLWHLFSNLVIAFGRKFGSIFLICMALMAFVFVYVFFIMG